MDLFSVEPKNGRKAEDPSKYLNSRLVISASLVVTQNFHTPILKAILGKMTNSYTSNCNDIKNDDKNSVE